MDRIIYDVPRWHVYLHRDERGLPPASPRDPTTLKFADELFDRLYAGESPQVLEPGDEMQTSWAQQVHEAASAMPAFTRLSEECFGDSMSTADATDSLLTELRPIMQATAEQLLKDREHLQRQIGAACDKAADAVAANRQARDALEDVGFRPKREGNAPGNGPPGGPGRRPGTGSAQGIPMARANPRQLATRLKNDERLKRIAMLAGKFKRIAQRKQKEKVRHSPDEITDVELGADLGRLLPSELMRLPDKRTRLAFLRDFTERRCLQYQLSGSETKGRGPIVVCLDKSGSMSGPSDIWATAVALALLEVAKQQKRPFALLSFDALVKHEVQVKAGDPLPEDALFVSCVGGTAIDRVLSRALEIIQKSDGAMKKADVVLVTDGQSETYNAPYIRQLAKGMGVTLLGIGIGVDKQDLEPWCDEAHTIRNLSADMSNEDATALFSKI